MYKGILFLDKKKEKKSLIGVFNHERKKSLANSHVLRLRKIFLKTSIIFLLIKMICSVVYHRIK